MTDSTAAAGGMANSTFLGYLIHLSVNMWSDVPLKPGEQRIRGHARLVDELHFDDELWAELTQRLAEAGFNAVVLDLGDGVRYQSHPEIAVRNAWTVDRLRSELSRLRDLGLTPIPKLNFSAAHDAWLHDYARQVSSQPYYVVCRDLISETAELFDGPELFHLGLDEETEAYQANYLHSTVRHGELWWHDAELLAEHTRAQGSRPWMWADMAWSKGAEYYERMSTDIMQSNWYYNLWFEGNEGGRPRALKGNEAYMAYLDLDEHGFDQIPTVSTWQNRWDNFALTAEFCGRRLDPQRLKGYLQATWLMTLPAYRDAHLRSIDVSQMVISDLHRHGQQPT